MFSRIVLATDGSQEADKAVSYALNLASRYHSKVYIVHAYTRIPEMFGEPIYDSMLSERTSDSLQILARAARPLRDAGVNVDTELLEGDAAEAILRVADIRDSDLIIIGARGMNELQERLLGSASYHVIHHAKCPVLVVR